MSELLLDLLLGLLLLELLLLDLLLELFRPSASPIAPSIALAASANGPRAASSFVSRTAMGAAETAAAPTRAKIAKGLAVYIVEA